MKWRIATSVLILVCVFSTLAVAQNRGSITGRVTDATDAVIPGVSIKVTNVNTGATRETITNETGVFTIDLLTVGAYQIEAELSGFKKEVRSGITLAVDQVVRQTFVLQVGTTSEIVEVTSSSPLVQTDNSSLGAVIEDKKVIDLPLNGRDFSALTYLVPGTFVPSQGSALGYRGGFTTGGVAETQSVHPGRHQQQRNGHDGNRGSRQHRCAAEFRRDEQLLRATGPLWRRSGKRRHKIRHKPVPRHIVLLHAQQRDRCTQRFR